MFRINIKDIKEHIQVSRDAVKDILRNYLKSKKPLHFENQHLQMRNM